MGTTVGGFHYNAPVQLVERSHPAPAILRVRVDRLTMLIAAHARGNSLSKSKLAELWNNLAQDWLDLSQPAQAQAAAGRALWIADEIFDEEAAVRALVIQAQAWICSGAYPEALSTLQRAQRLSATNPGIPAQMATLHARLNEWPQAEYAARLALRLDPNRTDCLNILALAAAESGDVLASIDILNKLLLIDRNCAAALANRARLCLITGDDAQAFADASRAASIEPCVPAHWNNRGIAYARLGHTDAALADFGRAIDLDARYSPAFLNRGILNWELGRQRAAIADTLDACELDPHFHALLVSGNPPLGVPLPLWLATRAYHEHAS